MFERAQTNSVQSAPSLPQNENVPTPWPTSAFNLLPIGNDSKIVLLRAHSRSTAGSVGGSRRVDRTESLGQMGSFDFGLPFTGMPAILQELQRLRLPSFDAKSTIGKDQDVHAVVEFSPSQEANRQRFAHSLATFDSQSLFDGGWWMPLGQENRSRP